MSEPWLFEARDLWKGYSNGTKDVEVLRGVDLSVRQGETVAVTGRRVWARAPCCIYSAYWTGLPVERCCWTESTCWK